MNNRNPVGVLVLSVHVQIRTCIRPDGDNVGLYDIAGPACIKAGFCLRTTGFLTRLYTVVYSDVHTHTCSINHQISQSSDWIRHRYNRQLGLWYCTDPPCYFKTRAVVLWGKLIKFGRCTWFLDTNWCWREEAAQFSACVIRLNQHISCAFQVTNCRKEKLLFLSCWYMTVSFSAVNFICFFLLFWVF